MFVCSAITDPRPGHDFGNVKSFTFDYSYWSTSSVSLSNLSYYVVTTIVKRKHKRKQMQDKYNLVYTILIIRLTNYYHLWQRFYSSTQLPLASDVSVSRLQGHRPRVEVRLWRCT